MKRVLRGTFFGSPVKRAKFSGLRRNVAIAMGNSRAHRISPQAARMARSGRPDLADAAAWAIAQIEERTKSVRLKRTGTLPRGLQEWLRCTLAAFNPFGPCWHSNSTASPSLRLL